ncbi:MAG: nucleoside triphosphate pyrophosphohydrolase family protein [Gammaproteobacteria bacterium]
MSYQNDVADFMKAGEQPVRSDLSLEGNQAISEEYQETLSAFKSNDMIEVADGLADMVWVIMGMCNSCGIDFDSVWQEVKASNMSKFPDGKAIKNEHGKIMKPDSYFKPNIKKVLGLEE